MLENEPIKEGKPLPEPVIRPVDPKATAKSAWRELFKGIYLKRTLMIWVLWIAVYTINNGMITWLPTLYTQVFDVPLQISLLDGWTTSAFVSPPPWPAPCSSRSAAKAGTTPRSR